MCSIDQQLLSAAAFRCGHSKSSAFISSCPSMFCCHTNPLQIIPKSMKLLFLIFLFSTSLTAPYSTASVQYVHYPTSAHVHTISVSSFSKLLNLKCPTETVCVSQMSYLSCYHTSCHCLLCVCGVSFTQETINHSIQVNNQCYQFKVKAAISIQRCLWWLHPMNIRSLGNSVD